MERSKQLGAEVFKVKTEKGAVLGVTGIKKVLLNAYNMVAGEKLRAFDSEEEAKEYLVKD